MTVKPRRGDLAGPALLIGFGALLLWTNLGRSASSLWESLSQVWPLALVAIGVDLMLPRRSTAAAVGVAALLLGIVIGGGYLVVSAPAAAPGGEAVTIPAHAAANEVRLEGGSGVMNIDSATAPGALLSGTVRLRDPEGLRQTVDGSRVVLRAAGTVFLPVNLGAEERWDLSIAEGASVDVEASLGAGEIRLDARRLAAQRLRVRIGAGRIEMQLGGSPVDVEVAGGVGEVVVHVPAGASVRISTSPVFGQIVVPPGYSRDNGSFRSPDYDADKAIEIVVSLAIGEVRVVED